MTARRRRGVEFRLRRQGEDEKEICLDLQAQNVAIHDRWVKTLRRLIDSREVSASVGSSCCVGIFRANRTTPASSLRYHHLMSAGLLPQERVAEAKEVATASRYRVVMPAAVRTEFAAMSERVAGQSWLAAATPVENP